MSAANKTARLQPGGGTAINSTDSPDLTPAPSQSRRGQIMTADALLHKLDGVRRTGTDRWIAKCPAHDDRRASLSIRELNDGRALLHDFAGCGVARKCWP
jgi:hypothetical protein